ncbi:LL-diaminopimelate aminotransferase [Clostridium acetobutylicum]|uniref:Aminotransferase n=1 Tax=Clostridium acetobutylicum (strain ATCC 824 / DSM 792 / JCM 1419 / IAM 19013 / LMG 5710 / NBRC 13948 / NRRL B-527 / VKM B-1787 / 2291 / W) TaxID=272562 RepID=Q97ID3_CLOAB|nr:MULTISPECIES: aminotransferase class I/II-fold pyridoxal phosphate-dependent enzyme [Clostridium]AAK79681.1 PLP-dependent aminotransferase [Clostridium acetobutylicum ATCC 824]ADZ20765.1 PLP-dependent aminotransferase [Clostridium acetobutylicum EA 2018]AEI33710.1 PLP-dependent aminotransferase [Clostridium acetobutylicum DSM 1731]AWV79884.1 aspartate aminotransferase [Clostridium acetobutylicum]MBC2394132.1 aminotransferase class I/II-fold pyridoxal phosphate-dependent enzyme [Clostridium 
MIKINNRLKSIDEYHFKKIEDKKRELIKKGKQIIDLGIGDPDLEVSNRVQNEIIKSLGIKDFNKYPPYSGIEKLKSRVIKYYRDIFQVNLDLDEIIITIGSKEGISSIIPSICDIGDYVIVPNPGYQVYTAASYLWGAVPYKIPLTDKNDYLPNLNVIPQNIALKSKLFFINYPNNPTGAEANKDFFKDIVEFCKKRNIVLVNDSAYNEIIKKESTPISLLQSDEDKKMIEIGSFSKTYNMTGFRVGYVVGNKGVIKALLKVKSNIDSGQFMPVQYAAAEAINLDRNEIKKSREIYDKRRSTAKKILSKKGIKYFDASAAFYIWCSVPKGYSTDEFCDKLLSEYGVVVTPGYCFGNLGYGFFRIALTTKIENIETALSKFEDFQ